MFPGSSVKMPLATAETLAISQTPFKFHIAVSIIRRESNSPRFRSPPFVICLVFIFERRQPFCKFALRRLKKDGGRNFFEPKWSKHLVPSKSRNADILAYFK